MGPSEQHTDHRRVTRPGLHVCPACERPFVIPLSVLEVLSDGRFPVVLGCRNCHWHEASTYTDEELEALDHALDAITGAMEDALDALVVAQELERIAAFATALDTDGILPEDF